MSEIGLNSLLNLPESALKIVAFGCRKGEFGRRLGCADLNRGRSWDWQMFAFRASSATVTTIGQW
jgi:hypothetical protein